MDPLNGFEVLKKIKKIDPQLCVVMVSAQESIPVAVNALKHGAFDYLVKNGEVYEKMLEAILRNYALKKREKTNMGFRRFFML